ncbi:MEKHLA domain protein [Paenibacillus curdlanolyticus YK9]|uniref:MEKHLA domain protein n=1 Tax=Paenibacillus curdlanolyticus YK9 TaxID=717606 RepID=E0I9X8_9BACL|nr:MEKHLA domain-containing protein [Paenibacillus curdlanolyticus]EFM10555.1 MEKHLA domain protein [Paenibacillus curdlanolyticus YK9]
MSEYGKTGGRTGIGATEAHARLIIESYRRLLGQDLIDTTLADAQSEAAGYEEALFNAPIVVLSHGTEEDPILNYGNAAALALWNGTGLRSPRRRPG